MERVAVIGAGSWGTAFAGVCAANAGQVSLWCHSGATADCINTTRRSNHYLLNYEIPTNIVATTSLEEALTGAELVVLALPSSYLRGACHDIARAGALSPTTPVLVLTKGVEPNTGMLMTDVVASELEAPERICALTGPNHAEEVSAGSYSAAVCAGSNFEVAQNIQNAINTKTFRVYVSDDERGAEICGAIKNVIAIACGIIAGHGLGDNTLAVIMTRGIAEAGRMVSAVGGNPMTCMGLAGMGDLVATCTSPHSRNRTFGEAFAAGTTLEAYEHDTHMVVEGARACVSIRELAAKCGVEVPIVEAVYQLLYEGASFDKMAETLSGRTPKEEFYGM